ncbi:MAG: acyltransferase family protein [Planctomycetes bacterium]|nr:acyltransferase family protein [Planctomycetota bacterium]
MTTPGARRPAKDTHRFWWLDAAKGLALVWIFLNHASEQVFGFPHIGNPTGSWPPLAERIAQLAPLTGHGMRDIAANLFRYVGWFGEQGVQIFIVLSGFGLVWGLCQRGRRPVESRLGFYRRRALRILPLWWGAHLALLACGILCGAGPSPFDSRFYLSFLGIRFTSELFYYIAPAWWYVGLAIQLYLVFPWLWALLLRLGPARFLLGIAVVALPIRMLGLALFPDFLDPWQRGAFFITRLPEFAFGMAVAAWYHNDPSRARQILRSGRALILGAFTYAIANILSLTLLGMAVAPALQGASLFVLLYGLLDRLSDRASRCLAPFTHAGRHSYSLYLMHHPLLLALLPAPSVTGVVVSLAVAAALTYLLSLALERVVTFVSSWIATAFRDGRIGRLIGQIALTGCAILILLLGAELLIRRFDPQEVLGWGERPALEPHPVFGWRLKPAEEFRLRWESYDYTVRSNSLGFPGPEPSAFRAPNTTRIFAAGDAFTSAEGVDTNAAWPRLLESRLATRPGAGPVEVLNFGMTAYGPNQYAAVVERFAPDYRPDLILIGFFVNDYEDVLLSIDQFRAQIGFGRPSPDSRLAFLRLDHLQRYLQQKLLSPFRAFLHRRPDWYGYFLGNFRALEKNGPCTEPEARARVRDRLERIRTVAESVGAKVVIVMIPAPVQVCDRTRLAYYPHRVDLEDPTRFDLDLPQRTTREIAAELGMTCLDLRSALQASVSLDPYQSRNMHFTIAGHRIVAAYLADQLIQDGYLGESR